MAHAELQHIRAGFGKTLNWRMPTFHWQDIGILPLLLMIPFMYMPKIVNGDTQPWIVSCAFIAFFTFRTDAFLFKRDVPLVALSLLCVAVYWMRSTNDFLLMRTCYIHISFIMLWLTCRRANEETFSATIKYTIILWFAVGVYEFTNRAMGGGLGMPELLTGRFGTGNGGIPSLTAEPSFYGSLSAVQMMYLLSENKRSNRIYIALAGISAVISGSLLAMTLLAFPLMKLPLRLRIAAFVGIPAMVVVNFMISSAGLLARVSFLQVSQSGGLAETALLDPSLNIRVGNVYFTLYHHFVDSITLSTPIQYLWEYSKFAKDGGIWWDPLTEYTIPFAGELIYGSGIFGLLLMFGIILAARACAKTAWGKLEKTIFIAACFLNPIAISNPLLIIYAQKRTDVAASVRRQRRRRTFYHKHSITEID